MTHARLAILPLLVVAAACASKSGAPAATAAGAPAPAARRGDPSVIRRTELTDVQIAQMNVYDVIQQVRPRMLSAASSSIGAGNSGTQVYLESSKMGGLEYLKQIRMAEIEEIRHLSGSEATVRYGSGHENGAIVLRRRR